MRNILAVEADIKGKRRVPAYTVTQNDSIRIVVTVLDGGEPVQLDDITTITLASTRRDGVVVVKAGEQSGPNEVIVDLGTTEIELIGKVDAVLQLYADEERVSTIKFAFTVTKDPTGEDYVPSEDERTLIEVILGDGPLVLERAETAADSAESAVEYIDDKRPLIDRFTDEQTNLQTQLDEVARGATNAETSQARVPVEGDAYPTLKARLDAEQTAVATQLAVKATADSVRFKTEKITLEDASNDLIEAITGGTTLNVLSEPQNYSVSPVKIEPSTLNSLYKPEKIDSSIFEIGSVSNGGSNSATTTRIRTPIIKMRKNTLIKINNTSVYKMAIHFYEDSVWKSYLTFDTWGDTYLFAEDTNVRLVGAYRDDRPIDNIYDLTLGFSILKAPVIIDEEVSSFKERIGKKGGYKYFMPEDLMSGSISKGAWFVSQTRSTTDYLRVYKGAVVKNLNPTYFKLAIQIYDLDKRFVRDIGFDKNTVIHYFQEDCYVRLVFAYKDDRVVSDIQELASYFQFEQIPELPAIESAREWLFKFNISAYGSYLSDFTFVGDELWTFVVTPDDHSQARGVARYNIDFENGVTTWVGSFTQNWGHCNTVKYSEGNDCLILGNGGNVNNVQPNKLFIFENASDFINRSSVDVSEAITFAIPAEWGQQVNAVWGESNGGKHNIAYVLTNNQKTQFVRKLLLGQGENEFEHGAFIEGKSENEFNGTYKILNTYTHVYGEEYAVQGVDYFNGVLYEGTSHDRASFFVKKFCEDGTIKSELHRYNLYNDVGNPIRLVTQGVKIKDGYMLIGNYPGSGINEVHVYKF